MPGMQLDANTIALWRFRERVNLLVQSQALTLSPWFAYNGGAGPPVASVAGAITAPDSTTGGVTRLDYPSIDTRNQFTVWRQDFNLTASGQQVTLSVWLRAVTGTTSISLIYEAGPLGLTFSTVCNLTEEWQRFSVTAILDSNTTHRFFIGTNTFIPSEPTRTARSILAWGAMVNTGATAAPYQRIDSEFSDSPDETGINPLSAFGSPVFGRPGLIDTAVQLSQNNYLASTSTPAGIAPLLLGDWTVEAWYKPLSSGNLHHLVTWAASQNADTEPTNFLMGVRLDTALRLGNYAETGAGTDINLTGITSLKASLGEWNHLAVVKKPSATPARADYLFYVNGQFSHVWAAQFNTTGGTSGWWFIGKNGAFTGTSDYADGIVDEVRVSKVARTAAEINANYLAGNPDPRPAAKYLPVDSDTIAYWHMDELDSLGTAYDCSGNEHHLGSAIGGIPRDGIVGLPGLTGTARQWNGGGTLTGFSASEKARTDLLNPDLTVMFWAILTSTTNAVMPIVAYGPVWNATAQADGSNNFPLLVSTRGSNGEFTITWENGSRAIAGTYTIPNALDQNIWTHLAVTRRWLGNSQWDVVVYKNGRQIGSSPALGGSLPSGGTSPTSRLTVAHRQSETNRLFAGLDEVYVSKRIFTAEEIFDYYAGIRLNVGGSIAKPHSAPDWTQSLGGGGGGGRINRGFN